MSEGIGSERLAPLRREHATLQQEMADPALHEDPARARRVGRRYAELDSIISMADQLASTEEDLAAPRELGEGDADFAAEAEQLEAQLQSQRERLDELLAPRDPDDGRDVILEVKAGAGGEESALLAAELLRMYRGYAEARGWKVEMLSSAESELGGLRDATVAITSPSGTPAADGVWAHLKHEAGVHRVQRVPVTESDRKSTRLNSSHVAI